MEAERHLAKLPYDLRRKEIAGRSYLYEIHARSGNDETKAARTRGCVFSVDRKTARG